MKERGTDILKSNRFGNSNEKLISQTTRALPQEMIDALRQSNNMATDASTTAMGDPNKTTRSLDKKRLRLMSADYTTDQASLTVAHLNLK